MMGNNRRTISAFGPSGSQQDMPKFEVAVVYKAQITYVIDADDESDLGLRAPYLKPRLRHSDVLPVHTPKDRPRHADEL